MLIDRLGRVVAVAALVASLCLAPSAVETTVAQEAPKTVRKPEDGGTKKETAREKTVKDRAPIKRKSSDCPGSPGC